MGMTIQFSDALTARIKEAAEKRGIAPEDVIKRALLRDAGIEGWKEAGATFYLRDPDSRHLCPLDMDVGIPVQQQSDARQGPTVRLIIDNDRDDPDLRVSRNENDE